MQLKKIVIKTLEFTFMRRSQALSALAVLAVACSDAPPREKFPGGHGRTTDIQQAQTTQAVLGGFDPLSTQLPAGSGAEGGQASAQGASETAKAPTPEESISGTIRLGRKVLIREGSFLFIAARPLGGGPPLAAKRMFRPDFPLDFTLSSADAMVAGTPFEGEVEITARIDQDGDPLSRRKGDFSGSVKTKVGAKNVKIVIDQPEG